MQKESYVSPVIETVQLEISETLLTTSGGGSGSDLGIGDLNPRDFDWS